MQVGHQQHLPVLQRLPQWIALAKQGFGVHAGRQNTDDVQQTRSSRCIFTDQHDLHVKMIHHARGQFIQHFRDVILAGSLIGNLRSGLHALHAAVQPLDVHSLIQLLVQQHRQAFAGAAGRLRLAVIVRLQKLQLAPQVIQSALVFKHQADLVGKQVQHFKGDCIRPAAILWRVERNQTQRFPRSSEDGHGQDVIRIPGACGFALDGVHHRHHVHVFRRNGQFVRGDEIRTADAEIIREHVLHAVPGHHPRSQFLPGVRRNAGAVQAHEVPRVRVDRADQYRLEGRGFANRGRDGGQRVLQLHIRAQGAARLEQPAQGAHLAAQRFVAAGQLIILQGIAQRHRGLHRQRLGQFQRGGVKMAALRSMQFNQAHRGLPVNQRHNQRGMDARVKGHGVTAVLQNRRLTVLNHLYFKRGQCGLGLAAFKISQLRRAVLIRLLLKQQDGTAIGLRGALQLVQDQFEQILEVQGGAQLAVDARQQGQLIQPAAQTFIRLD